MTTHQQILNNAIIRHSGFNLFFNDKESVSMIFDKLSIPVITSFAVGTASATIQKTTLMDNPNLVVGLLGIIVTIGLWGLGHLITLSIKMSRVETQIEDIKSQLNNSQDG